MGAGAGAAGMGTGAAGMGAAGTGLVAGCCCHWGTERTDPRPIRSSMTPTSATAAASQARTAATDCRMASATAVVTERFMPVRRGVSAMATCSAMIASAICVLSPTPVAASSATTCASRPRPAPLAPSRPGSGSASRIAKGSGSAGSGYARSAAGYSSRSTSRRVHAAPCRPVLTAACAARTGLSGRRSRGVACGTADRTPACSARARPIARRSAGLDSSSSIESSSPNRSA